MFETLRDEIVNDELLAGQPESSKAWVKEVRWGKEAKRSPAHQWSGGWARRGAADWPQSLPNGPMRLPLLMIYSFSPQMMDYNVPLGKLNRGMAVLDVVRRCCCVHRGGALDRLRPAPLRCCRGRSGASSGSWGDAPDTPPARSCNPLPTTLCPCVAPTFLQARSLAESKGQQLGDEEVFRAQALGWCIEFLQVRSHCCLCVAAWVSAAGGAAGLPCWGGQAVASLRREWPDTQQSCFHLLPPRPTSWWRMTSWTAASRGAASPAGTASQRCGAQRAAQHGAGLPWHGAWGMGIGGPASCAPCARGCRSCCRVAHPAVAPAVAMLLRRLRQLPARPRPHLPSLTSPSLPLPLPLPVPPSRRLPSLARWAWWPSTTASSWRPASTAS